MDKHSYVLFSISFTIYVGVGVGVGVAVVGGVGGGVKYDCFRNNVKS